jgi:hemolysin III
MIPATLTARPDARAAVAPDPSSGPPEQPVWRGRLHSLAFLVSIPLGGLLVSLAHSAHAALAAMVYAAGSIALYGVSAAYHRGDWDARGRVWMRRLDHAMIFVLIAATYTPFCLLAATPDHGAPTLFAVWSAAALGVTLSLTGLAEKRGLGLALYLALGWLGAFTLPSLMSTLAPLSLLLVVGGGLTYTVGAIALALRWPDPLPDVFGYHEVWHAMTLVAGGCFAVVVWGLVTGP